MSTQDELGSREDQLFVQTLISLAHLEIAAIDAYDHALEFIEIEFAFAEVALIQDEHERHRLGILEILKKYGITSGAADKKHDLLVKDMERIEKNSGNEGIFKALGYNEEVINSAYAAAKKSFSQEYKNVMHGYLLDEERHLKMMNRMIEEEIWNQQTELKDIG